MKKLLVVVDYQNDFVAGALGFAGAEKLEESILAAVEQTLQEGGFVLFTRDTHAPDYLTTREGAYLPVAHCVQGTPGHQLFGRLHRYELHPEAHTALLDKFTFGAPHIGEEAVKLCGTPPDVVEVCGVVTDICVIANAILLHSFLPVAQIRVVSSLCGSGNAENAGKALDVLRGMGVEILP